jgi:hypothetical protein
MSCPSHSIDGDCDSDSDCDFDCDCDRDCDIDRDIELTACPIPWAGPASAW